MNKLRIIKLQQEEIVVADQEVEIEQEISIEAAEEQSQRTVVDSQSTMTIKSATKSKYNKLIGGNLIMTTFNEQGIKLVEEIKTNSKYSFIKKEALIQFGFDLIILEELVEWLSYSYMEDFEEITGDDVQNKRRYTPETIDLLTEFEREEIGNISEKDSQNQIVGYITADGQTTSVTRDIENRKRKERFAIVNKKEWFEIGQALKEKRLELGISLTKMGQILRTSASRISNLENGKAVMMADHLRASYELALELERINQQEKEKEVAHKETSVNHIKIALNGEKLQQLNLILASEGVIHIQNITI